MGSCLAHLWVRCGYSITVTNSRGPSTMTELICQLGSGAEATLNEHAIRRAEVVVLTLPWRARREIVRCVTRFSGKIVVDVMNAYDPYPKIIDLGGVSSSLLLASELKGARVVKALNTIQPSDLDRTLRSGCFTPRAAVPLCGDDADAKHVVALLIHSIGFEPVDMGALLNGRLFEPGQPLFGRQYPARQLRREFLKQLRGSGTAKDPASTLIS